MKTLLTSILPIFQCVSAEKASECIIKVKNMMKNKY